MYKTNDGKDRTVLVIEDDEINREILDAILSPYYTVLQAENGKAGLDILESRGKKISLILLDIQMPVMNGFEFLEAVSSRPSLLSIPIIVTTSSASATDEIKCLENGATDFVAKPYNPDIVLRRVGSMIRLSEASSIIEQVEYDDLTGFYNRDFFFANVDKMLEENPDTDYDIACCKLMSLKMIEARYGTDEGSKLVSFVAGSIKGHTPKGAICGRLNNEDLVVFSVHNQKEYYEKHAERIRDLIKSTPVPDASLHIGLYSSVGHNSSASSLCDNVLAVIEDVRYQYGKQIAEFNEQQKARRLRQQAILGFMENALKENQFDVYYQPKHRLDGDRIGGAEALVRWTHPTLGFISPGEFIPLFEASGFITELSFYVAERVCRDIRSWLDAGFPKIPVSWNLSRLDFEYQGLAEEINRIVNKYLIPHELIHLEVTESAYAEAAGAFMDNIGKLRDMGFTIELDDFGSGYSSFNALSDLNIDVLKLDMCFARNLDSEKQQLILEHIFSIANNLGMSVVAEGVETDSQVETYRQMGCTYIQGYYYSKPLPKDQFEKYLIK